MDVLDAIRTRRSIRRYQDTRIATEVVECVLDAARLAPSAGNRQPWRFIVVTNPALKEQLKLAYDREWFASAPVIIVACATPDDAWTRADGEPYWKVDTAIALQNLILAAWDSGLGTCWIGAFRERVVKALLKVPDAARVVAMTPLGYPAEDKGPVTDRKPLEEIIRQNSW